MGRLAIVLLVAAVGGLVAGCGMAQDKQDAEAVGAAYLAALRNQDLNKALSLCDARMFTKSGITEAEWRKFLGNVTKKLGKMQSYRSVGWRLNKQATTDFTGTACTLAYEVTYAKYPSQETLLLVRDTGSKTFRVAGHNINSKGLLLN